VQYAAVAAHVHFKLQIVEEVAAVHTGGVERLLRGQVGENFVLGQAAQIVQFHGHVQRLVQIRVQLVLTHPQCSRQPGRHGRQSDKAYPKFSEH